MLILYIGKTFATGNYADNLLEPLTLSYLFAMIVLYVLVGLLKNAFVRLFRFAIPKVLVPVAVFQIVLSVLSLSREGMTHGRYFVLLFCLFSAAVGIFLSINRSGKNHRIAFLAAAFAAVSLLPFAGAFPVAKQNQQSRLNAALLQNNMLQNGQIVPNTDIPGGDKEKISFAVRYYQNIGTLGELAVLPQPFDLYADFERVFGFPVFEPAPARDGKIFFRRA